MAYEKLILEKKGEVTTLTLNRPRSHNALDRALSDELNDALRSVQRDRDCRILVLTGAGDKPTIAKVHGYCVGGGSELALCADLVVAADDARIGTPYSRGCRLRQSHLAPSRSPDEFLCPPKIGSLGFSSLGYRMWRIGAPGGLLYERPLASQTRFDFSKRSEVAPREREQVGTRFRPAR